VDRRLGSGHVDSSQLTKVSKAVEKVATALPRATTHVQVTFWDQASANMRDLLVADGYPAP
jgi:hypothetical protein